MPIDLEKTFGPDLVAILEELDTMMSPEIETLLGGIAESMTYDVQTFNNRTKQLVSNLTYAGATKATIESVIAADFASFGRISGELNNAIKNSVVQGIMMAAQQGEYENYETLEQKFTWVTVSGKVCKDCAGVGGKTKKFSEWESHGLPGSGWSVCRHRCYCVLDPTGTLPKSIPKPDVREYKAQ